MVSRVAVLACLIGFLGGCTVFDGGPHMTPEPPPVKLERPRADLPRELSALARIREGGC